MSGDAVSQTTSHRFGVAKENLYGNVVHPHGQAMLLDPGKLKAKLTGLMPAMVTPFKEDFEIDRRGLQSNVDFLIENGIDVLVPCGTNGEFSSLTVDEIKEVIKIVVDQANGKVPVVAGTSSTSTRVAIELAKYAQDVGASGVMVLPPYYVRPSPDEIYRHFEMVANAIDIGVVIYNNPSTTKIELKPDFLINLTQIPNIVGVKETITNTDEFQEALTKIGDKMAVITGSEVIAIFCFILGSKSIVSPTPQFAPQLLRELLSSVQNGDLPKAFEIHRKLIAYRQLFAESTAKGFAKYIHYTKAAMNLMGLAAGPTRPPLLPLSNSEIQKLERVLREELRILPVAKTAI